MNKSEITRLLHRWQDGDAHALEAMFPLLYEDLRQMAGQRMRSERDGHTLQPTALVHEAYLQAMDLQLPIANRSHFLALMARIMRRVLVAHARSVQREKRGGQARRLSLDELPTLADMGHTDFIEIDQAMSQLGQIDARKEEILVAHYFGGLSREEIAEALSLSLATVDRDLRYARAWLNRQLSLD